MSTPESPDELRARLDLVDDAARALLVAAGWQRLDHKGQERWQDPTTGYRWKLLEAVALVRKDLGA